MFARLFDSSKSDIMAIGIGVLTVPIPTIVTGNEALVDAHEVGSG
jgi:hypothetical protein